MNRLLSAWLWVLPLVIHVAYLLATVPHLPNHIGDAQSFAGNVPSFLLQWAGTILFANAALVIVKFRLPSLSDRQLAVPGRDYWLQTPERRTELLSRLRGLIETCLCLFNVFLLAIYQRVYQTNAVDPVLRMPDQLLMAGFVALPLMVMGVTIAMSMISLKKDARD